MNVWSNGKFSLLCFGAVVLMTGVAAAKPAYVASTVNLRAAPGTGSEIVAKIPGGSLVAQHAMAAGARSPGRTNEVLRSGPRSI